MPELPEVEVTRRSVASGLLGARVRSVELGLPLRWPLGCDPQRLTGAVCGAMSRRGKYLWLPLSLAPVRFGDVSASPARAIGSLPGLPRGDRETPEVDGVPAAGGLLIHLGMSGALSLVEA